MTDVHAPAGPYGVALAELPLRTRRVDRPADAIVVVPGVIGWVDAARDAASEGALALVIAGPEYAPAADVQRLSNAVGIPVIVERPLLRADSADDARAARRGRNGWAAPRAVVVDGAAAARDLWVVARDAVGWVRVLTGDEPLLVAANGMPALLETLEGVAATLSVVATSGTGSWVRAQALGEVVTEVEVDGHGSRVVTATAAGRLIAPTRFESSERLALRRALAAVGAGRHSADLADLADLTADTALAETILPATT